MEFSLFEDDKWGNFLPISATRHLGQQLLGTVPLLEHAMRRFGVPRVSLLGRNYLKDTVEEATRLDYNASTGAQLLVNARLNPLLDVKAWTTLPPGSAVFDRGEVAIASVRTPDLERLVSLDGTIAQSRLKTVTKGMERLEAPQPLLFTHPWELLESNGTAIWAEVKKSQNRVVISEGAQVEEFVTFDPTGGPIIIDEGARVESFSRLSGPCYVGKGASVLSGLIRGGTTIGEGCKVGGEVAHSVLYGHTNKAHLGYLGHSLVGEWVNIGAGAVTSDLKNTYGTIRVVRGQDKVDTGLVKLGAMVGDMARVSIGSMLYGGKTVGVAARCAGVVDRDVPDFTSYDGAERTTSRLDLAPVLIGQGRMMSRRERSLSTAQKAMLKHLYSEAFRSARSK